MPSARPHHRLCRLLCRLVLALARRQERAVKLDEMMKRKSHANIDEKKVYKEGQDGSHSPVIEKESPSSINEDLIDQMLLDDDNNK